MASSPRLSRIRANNQIELPVDAFLWGGECLPEMNSNSGNRISRCSSSSWHSSSDVEHQNCDDDESDEAQQHCGVIAADESSFQESQCHSRVPACDAFEQNDSSSGQDRLDVLLRLAPAGLASVSPLLSQQHNTVPFNDLTNPVQIDTPLFRGTATVLLKNLPNTPVAMFHQRRRLMWFSIQGRFKQPVSYDSLMLGSEFQRPLQLPAAGLLTRAAKWLVQRMGSGVQLNAAGAHPYILAPLAAAAQVINVSLPGQQPGLFDAQEDMTLADSSLVGSTGQPLSSGKRKWHFSSKANRQGRYFDTEHVWTFQVYDQGLDYATFMLAFPLFKLDLVQVLAGQPLQLMLKDLDSSRVMMQFEVWHKRMLQHKANTAAAAAATGGAAAATGAAAGRAAEQHRTAAATAASGRVQSHPVSSDVDSDSSDSECSSSSVASIEL